MATINNSINNTLQTPFHLGAISVSTTGTQFNYLNATTGVTGTGNLALSISPAFSTSLHIDNLELSGNTFSSTNSNGNINLSPNGSGFVSFYQTSGVSNILRNFTYTADRSNSSEFVGFKSHSNTVGVFSPVVVDEPLCQLQGFGDDGTQFTVAGYIQILCDGSVSNGVVPGRLAFYTSNASGVNTIAAIINSSQIASFVNPIVTSGIKNSSGDSVLLLSSTSSSVNYLQINATNTGSSPSLQSAGSDTNVNLGLATQGTGVVFITSLSNSPFEISSGTGYQHTTNFSFANTAQTRTVTFQDASGTLCMDTSSSGSITTAPPVSASSTLVVGTAYQNTLGYDIVLTVYLSVTAATTASILLGVGTTTTPTQQTIVSSLTTAAIVVIPVTIYLPNNYYAKLSTSGTITQTISGQQAMAV